MGIYKFIIKLKIIKIMEHMIFIKISVFTVDKTKKIF